MTGIRRRLFRASLFVLAAGLTQTAVAQAQSRTDTPAQVQRVRIESSGLAERRSSRAAPPRMPAAGTLPSSAHVLAKGPSVSTQDSTVRHYTSEESAALGAAADRRAVEQQRLWDRHLKQISGSICDGC